MKQPQQQVKYMKPLIKYRCQSPTGEIGYAVYYRTMDAVQFTTWGNVIQKHESGIYAMNVGHRSNCIGRPGRLIEGYTIEGDWTKSDERIFQSEGYSKREALDMGFMEEQLSLF